MSRLELTAAAACITYVERTQLGQRPPLSPPLRESQEATLLIDQATRANLELVRTLSGERCRFAAGRDRPHRDGGRARDCWRNGSPLRSPIRPPSRVAMTRWRISSPMLNARARHARTPESRARPGPRAGPARGRSRRTARPGGDPRRDRRLPRTLRRSCNASRDIPAELAQAAASLCRPDPAIASELAAALDDELPYLKRDGGFVRPGL